MTGKFAHGQCPRCSAYADGPTYECATCNSNDVERFPKPVVHVTASHTDEVSFDGDEPANVYATAHNTRDGRHHLGSIMMPAAVMLALFGSVACLIGAYQGGVASVSISLIVLGTTGGPFVLFGLGALGQRRKEQAFASAAAMIGAVMSLGAAFVSGLAGSFLTSSGATSSILSDAPLLFVVAALAGGIAAGSHR